LVGVQFSVVGSQFSVEVCVMSRGWLSGLLLACLLAGNASAVTFPSSPDSQSAGDKSNSAKAQSGAPAAADIAVAKASGKVWVNLDSGVYHKAGRWYGKTKNGKFMTVDEAKKAGYKASKRE
jgi:hypothetical protein